MDRRGFECAEAKIKRTDDELTLVIEDDPCAAARVDEPLFLTQAVALRGWRAARLGERRLKRDLADWGQNSKATLKGLKRWIYNNWVKDVCQQFQFAGDAVFGYARIAATKTYHDANKQWQFDIDGHTHTFFDEHMWALPKECKPP